MKYRILLMTLLVLIACQQKDESQTQPMEFKNNINGTMLYFKVIGEGEPILMIHGGPAFDHSYLLPHFKELAKKYQLIFYDQRASGRSTYEVPDSAMTLENFIKDIESIRRDFEIDKINILAHSWGGILGMLYASEYPEHVKRLMLISSNSASQEFEMESFKRFQQRQSPKENHEREELMATDAFQAREPQAIATFFQKVFKASFYDKSYSDSLKLYFSGDYGKSADKLQHLNRDLGKYDFHSKLSNITAPTLIVHGDYDLLPVAAAEKLHEHIPNSELVIMRNCGHFPFIEKPDEFSVVLRKFLAKSRS